MKSTYLVQPYHVGSRKAKSLALVIPAEVAKEYNITDSTVFALRLERSTRKIILYTINGITEAKKESTISADKSLECSGQQISSIGDQ